MVAMSECNHVWVGPGHPCLYGCEKCGMVTMCIPGAEEIEAQLMRVRCDVLGVEETDRLYAEAAAIIRGDLPMPEFPTVRVAGIGLLQHETSWKRVKSA